MSFCRAYPKYGECHPPPPPPKFIVDILFMALARASPPGINFIWATFAHPPRPYFGRSGRANGREFVQNAIDLFSIEIIMRNNLFEVFPINTSCSCLFSLITIGPPRMQLPNEKAAFKSRTSFNYVMPGSYKVMHTGVRKPHYHT